MGFLPDVTAEYHSLRSKDSGIRLGRPDKTLLKGLKRTFRWRRAAINLRERQEASLPWLTGDVRRVNVTNLAAVTVVALVFYVGVRYCLKFRRGEISPRIATWLIFEIGVAMSLASYLAGPEHSLTKAALNVADCPQVTVILLVLLVGHGRRKLDFTPKERLSLWIAEVAATAWMLTKAGWVGFIGFQTVMSVAYLRRWKASGGESLENRLNRWTSGA